jgi:valyl-tRNA synthetase
MQLEKVYEPSLFEARWAQWWVDQNLFRAGNRPDRDVFSLAIPPPNVTGSLHMGHMLEHTLIDVMVRWQRMCGKDTLWLPGTDHAGIATQMVVERNLAKENVTRRDLGREKFEARVWEWKAQSGGRIIEQMKSVGASCDWSRERFTMDEGLSRAVREVFVRLHEKGLVYRGEYMVNWCPRCATALSDLEVAHKDHDGKLWHIRYATPDGGHLTVATTRPETMLGDTAVAVHPEDERYLHLHGKTVRLPLVDRDIPVIADEMVDRAFGTGVVKITPAHDPNDFEAGKRHDLPLVRVIGEDGRMRAEAGAYAGLDRFEARKQVLQALEQAGLLEKTEDHKMSIGQCDRCTTVVEPLVSKQWFLRMKPLAEPAIRAVEEGRTTIEPPQWRTVYFNWMHNIRDWCVSRQLWWGHRIPAWHCRACENTMVAREAPLQCSNCGSAELAQETDVLDTWFSSGLWPFSTLGWPDNTPDLQRYYPTKLMIMGFEILFFWCARMMMMGIEFMGEPPFREVYIHGIVRDKNGNKMSKTRGNTIDPLDITSKYGTDAVRMALLTAASPGADILWTEDKLPSSRAFANKIWNAARFLFLNMEKAGVAPAVPAAVTAEWIEDRWIRSRLNEAAETCNRAIAANRYHEAAQAMWRFFWDEFCDWYIELKKLRFVENSGLDNSWVNLLRTFEAALRLLHPAMPFLTEELWQRLSPPAGTSIALAEYPQPVASEHDAAAEADMALLQEIITAARTLRAEHKLDPRQQLKATVHARPRALALLQQHGEFLRRLGNVDVELRTDAPEALRGAVRSTPEFDLLLHAPAAQAGAQRERVEKEIKQLRDVIANSQRQLNDERFMSRAPEHIKATLRQKLADYEAQLRQHESTLVE